MHSAPQNYEAEQGLLGLILSDNRNYDRVSTLIKSDDFYNNTHAKIYRAISSEIEQGREVNYHVLASRFEKEDSLKDIGSKEYLKELQEEVPLLSNIKDYAETISLCAYKRSVLYAINDMRDIITNPDYYEAGKLVNDLESVISNIGDQSESQISIEKALEQALRSIEKAQSGEQVVYNTGIAQVDKIISGLRPSGLYILAGRPGMGKTALAVNISEQIAQNKPVLFFSLEMPSNELSMRLIADKTNISVSDQMNANLQADDMRRIVEAQNKIKKLKLAIDDRSGVDINYIASQARRFARKYKDCTIVIDYLGLIRGDNRMNKVHQIEEITTRSKALAKEIKAPVLLLSQLSRAVEQREDKRPVLSDLRDSGAIEQDADVILFTYRSEYYTEREKPQNKAGDAESKYYDALNNWQSKLDSEKGKAQVIVAKNRQGESNKTAYLKFDGVRQRFSDD